MMNDLDDIAAWNVQSASTTTPTTNNTPAGTNPAVNTTTPTNMTGVPVVGTNPAANTTTTNLQEVVRPEGSLPYLFKLRNKRQHPGGFLAL